MLASRLPNLLQRLPQCLLQCLFVALSLFVLFTFPVVGATLKILEPAQLELGKGDFVDLGLVGPGQKVEIVALRSSTEIIKRPGYEGVEALWDQLLVVDESLPRNWRGIDSLVYESPMRAFVIVAPDAQEGGYEFELKSHNLYGDTPPLSIRARLNVSQSVLGAQLLTPILRVGVEQPAQFIFKVTNTGSASDVYEVSVVDGIPSTWRESRRIFVPRTSTAFVSLELLPRERGEWAPRFVIASLSNPKKLRAELSGALFAESSLANDLLVIGNGLLLYPTIAQAIYALIGLVANLLVLTT